MNHSWWKNPTKAQLTFAKKHRDDLQDFCVSFLHVKLHFFKFAKLIFALYQKLFDDLKNLSVANMGKKSNQEGDNYFFTGLYIQSVLRPLTCIQSTSTEDDIEGVQTINRPRPQYTQLCLCDFDGHYIDSHRFQRDCCYCCYWCCVSFL